VFQVAHEGRRVGLDRLGAEPDVARTGVGALPEVHPPFEGDAEDDDAGVGERQGAADEARRDRTHEFFVTLAARQSIASGNCSGSGNARASTDGARRARRRARQGSKGPVPEERRRRSRAPVEPSRSGAANACRVVVSTLAALAAAFARRRVRAPPRSGSSEVSERRFFLAMGQNGPYSETSFVEEAK